MIPDKLYLNKYMFRPGMMRKAQEPADEPEYEYIRKDVLLEWANSWLAFKRSGLVLDDGFSYAMEELIKKINEM